ncbi:MAG: sodium:solute symporter family protein [Bacteriovoracaceae bacterium]
MNLELLGISFYVLAMLGLGFYVSKKIKTDDDYFLAGRSLGPFLATFSIFATWFGAETCIGTAGAVYSQGLHSIHADPLGYAFCLLLMGLFFSRILWQKKITTIPDLFRERFSPTTEQLTALIMIPSSIIWAAAQIRAFGQVIHASTEFSVSFAITVAALVVVIYTISGGLLADAYTDLIQGIALIIGLFILLAVMIHDGGGPLASAKIIWQKEFWPNYKSNLGLLGRVELWMVPVLGSVMSQELVSRVVASRSPEVARASSLRACAIYLLVGFIPVLVGLLGSEYFPNLEQPETIMPLLAKTHLNSFLYIVFIGALVSAILSTVDTALLSASALFSHNLVYPFLPNVSERKKVFIARCGVFISGIIAYVIAYFSESIAELIELATSLGGPIILVITLIALYVKTGTAKNALVSIIASCFTWVIAHFIFEVDFPVLLTMAVSVVFYFASLPFVKTEMQKQLS